MNFRFPALLAATGAAILSFSSPASAALVLNPNGSVTTSGTSGGTVTLNFDGFGGESPVVIPGLTGQVELTFVSLASGVYTFNYKVLNTSSSPITGSRISIFGFNTDPNFTSATASGLFNTAGAGNVPIFGSVEFCAKDGGSANNCAGGGNGGVDIGQTSNNTGTFTLNFGNSAPSAITLNNFVIRYQSIVGAGNVTSAVGRQTPPVPEPGTWAMMLVGFGAIGFAMRRGRKIRAQFKGGLPQLA